MLDRTSGTVEAVMMCSDRIALAVVVGALWTGAPLDAEVSILKSSQTIESQLSGHESREYAVTLDKGQYSRIMIEQRTVNVAIVVLGPDDKERFTSDTSSVG